MAEWLSHLVHQGEFVAVHAFMTLAFSMRVEGRWRFPCEGPVLVISNHQSYLDPLMLGLSAPRRMAYLARKTLFRNPAFNALIRHLGAFPIDRDGVGKEGIKTVLKLLARGKAVVVFPEGHRTEDGRIHPFKPGIHLLIQRVRAPIVPIGLAGAYQSWPPDQPYPVPAPLFLAPTRTALATVVGEPLDSQPFSEMSREECVDRLFKVLQAVQARAERLRRKPVDGGIRTDQPSLKWPSSSRR